VPVVETLQRSPWHQRHLRSEAPFQMHLIAAAGLTAQNRTVLRLTEAQAAYQSMRLLNNRYGV
jgi:hypothetical protein